jgi:hypothetical protein
LVLRALVAQLTPHLELDNLRRPLRDRTWNGIEMPVHQLLLSGWEGASRRSVVRRGRGRVGDIAATVSGDDRTRTGGLSPDKRALWPLSYAPEKRQMCCVCRSPTLRPWIATTLSLPCVFVEAFWSPVLVSGRKCAGKSSRHICSFNYRVSAGEDLSLSDGASMSFSDVFKLGLTSLVAMTRPQTKRATLSGRPRVELLCR